MDPRVTVAGVLIFAMGTLTPLAPGRATDVGNNVNAGDNIVSLPDQAANDEELGNQRGTPPQSASSGMSIPPAQNVDATGSMPSFGPSGGSTFSGDTTGIAVSTVNAAITNNDVHN